MTKLPINENSTIMECYEHFESQHNHAANTKMAYLKNCQSFQDFMEDKGVEPLVKNIDYNLAKEWESSLEKMSMANATIKQMIASLKRINNYLINLGILTANPFSALDERSAAPDNYHSRALSISDLYKVYKKAKELDEKGKNVLMSTLIAMYSGVRNNTLCKLKVNSITDDGLLNVSHINSNKNSKNKDLSIPLPPGLLRRLHD